VLIGAQVRQTGGFVAALRRAEDIGADFIQLFPQNNRQWRLPEHPEHSYCEYAAAREVSRVRGTVCHAPYLINLISPDPLTAERSFESLVRNLRASAALGAIGLVFHPGSHRRVDPETAVERLGERCSAALDTAAVDCHLLLENTAGAGGSLGRSFVELGAIIAAAGADERIGVCLDTQHLFAVGESFGTLREADAVVAALDRHVGLDRLRCVHLNDSKVPCGAKKDRHESLGEGWIGRRGFRALLGHPALQGLPAVLEVPGYQGRGPGAADVKVARELHAAGLAARRRGRKASCPQAPSRG
jgi:deoxyribonuclease-4